MAKVCGLTRTNVRLNGQSQRTNVRSLLQGITSIITQSVRFVKSFFKKFFENFSEHLFSWELKIKREDLLLSTSPTRLITSWDLLRSCSGRRLITSLSLIKLYHKLITLSSLFLKIFLFFFFVILHKTNVRQALQRFSVVKCYALKG